MARATTPKSETATATATAAEEVTAGAPEGVLADGGLQPQAQEQPEFDWTDLDEAKPQEYTRVPGGLSPRKDYEKETPEVIKNRVIDSFNVYQAAMRKHFSSGKSENLARTHARMDATRVQTCRTNDQAGEFYRIAKTYAKFRGWTLRGEVVLADEVNGTAPKVVYVVKPGETRERRSA